MKDRLVIEALQKAVIAAVAASSLPTLPIKALMRNFEIPSDQKYLEVVYIPNNINGEFWNDEKTYQGIMRLILHWPINDDGAYEPLDVITSIASYFTKNRALQNGSVTVKIYQNPDLTGVIEGEKDNIFPVSIFNRCFVT